MGTRGARSREKLTEPMTEKKYEGIMKVINELCECINIDYADAEEKGMDVHNQYLTDKYNGYQGECEFTIIIHCESGDHDKIQEINFDEEYFKLTGENGDDMVTPCVRRMFKDELYRQCDFDAVID
jgi:hypothetical protein